MEVGISSFASVASWLDYIGSKIQCAGVQTTYRPEHCESDGEKRKIAGAAKDLKIKDEEE